MRTRGPAVCGAVDLTSPTRDVFGSVQAHLPLKPVIGDTPPEVRLGDTIRSVVALENPPVRTSRSA